MKTLISGITGQDGSYLAEFLLNKGYQVHGIVRHTANELNAHHFWRLKKVINKITFHSADLTSYPSLHRVISEIKPDEFYHLGAISYVGYTFADEYSCFNTNLHGTHYILSIIRDIVPECKLYFAGTSEMFGNTIQTPQNELTSFYPCSPYGISKYAAFNLCQMYRKAHNSFITCGILFNHTSERRGEIFASRKITRTAAKIKLGLEKKLVMGNIDIFRDFGYAPEYVEAMWLMLQQNKPNDFVIATGDTHSIREIIEIAFGELKLNYKKYLKFSAQFRRKVELIELCGNYDKAYETFGWQPKTKFEDIIKIMVRNDLKELNDKRHRG